MTVFKFIAEDSSAQVEVVLFNQKFLAEKLRMGREYLFYGKVMVNSKTGKGPALIPGVGYRFPKDSTLMPTASYSRFRAHTPHMFRS